MARIKKIKFCSPNTAIFGHVTHNHTLLCIFLSTISVVCLLFYLNFLHELQIQIFVPFFQLIVTFSYALSFNIGFFSPNFLCFFPQKMLKLFYSLFLFLALGQEGSSMQYYTVNSGPVPQFFAVKCANLGPLSLLSDKPTTSHLFLFHVFVWIYKLSDILTYFFFVRVSQTLYKVLLKL